MALPIHFDAARHDLSYAVRQLRRAPAFAVTVVATFALGVGANATMFGLVDRLLFRGPPHVAAPAELVRVQTGVHRHGRDDFVTSSFSYPAYVAVRDQVPALSSVLMTTYPNPTSLGLGASAHAIQYVLVSGNYFQTLGARVTLGRPILPADDLLPHGSPVAVIGYGLWQREFGGDPAVLRSGLTLAGRRYAIIGVAPPDFTGVGTRPIDVWIPVSAGEGLRFVVRDWATTRTSLWMSLVARLAPGASPSVAGEQVAAAMRAYREAGTGRPDTTTYAVVPPSILPNRQSTLSAEHRVALLLGGVSVLVLLIACANVANLLLARALRRRREIAVRLALGISRARLMRQLSIEALLLAGLGGLAALAVVHWGTVFVYRALLADAARPEHAVDLRVLGFTAVAAIIVGLLAAAAPALQASQPDLTRDLKDGTRGAGMSHSRTRVMLLLAQAALSVVLLAGAGLFVSSLRNLARVPLGLDVDHLVIGRIDLQSVGIDSARAEQYFRDATAQARRIPGVVRAVYAEAAPFSEWQQGTGIKVPGRDSVPHFENGPNTHGVTADYFAAAGTRIVSGRALDAGDESIGAERVVVINESAARLLWPNEQAVGKCIQYGPKQDPPCARIVGVAEDAHFGEIIETGTRLQIYHPIGVDGAETRAYALIVRAAGDPAALVEPLRRVMQTVTSGLPSANVRPMAAELDQELRPWRLGATLFGAFGAVALVLAALGLYGVVAYSVAQRAHEMGVRVALGATARDIAWLVLSRGLAMAAAGIAIGLGLSVTGARFIGPLLYNVSPRDPAVLSAVAVALLATAAAASLVPARRAMRADPLDALRAE